MKTATITLAFSALLALTGCWTTTASPEDGAKPETAATAAGHARPQPQPAPHVEVARATVGVRNAPAGARLLIDGIDVGPASRYDGVRLGFPVRNGLRTIQVTDDTGKVLFTREELFTSDTAKVYLMQ